MAQKYAISLTQPSNETLGPDSYLRYSQGTFKRRSYLRKNPIFTTIYQNDYCRPFNSKFPRENFSRCFQNTGISFKNTFLPKFACQNHIVNRIYNKTLDGLIIKPRKNFLKPLPFIQTNREITKTSKSISKTVPMETEYSTTMTHGHFTDTYYKGYKDSSKFQMVDTVPNDSKSNYNTVKVSKSVEIVPPRVKVEDIGMTKEKLNEILKNHIPKKEDFQRPSILNNYKPFLIDNFYRYSEY